MTSPKVNSKRGASIAAFSSELDGKIECPWCGSMDTVVRSPFGGTVSEVMMQCKACNSGFGWMKWQGIKPSSPSRN
ncbi:MAG: hypothetical protein KF874_03860 [Rhizobiaceae bacterium]|nr:hypothetical protein [Rhizobiaceae bacterium]